MNLQCGQRKLQDGETNLQCGQIKLQDNHISLQGCKMKFYGGDIKLQEQKNCQVVRRNCKTVKLHGEVKLPGG